MNEKRLNDLLNLLEEENYCSVNRISQALFISLPTVRRDLAELERRGLVVRNHGGAKRISDDKFQLPFEFKNLLNINAKKRFCKAAANLVQDNDIIFVDASTSVLHVADYLKAKKNLTVITNGFVTASVFGKAGFNVFCTGGKLIPSSLSFSGDHAANLTENYNIDVMIFSASGVNDSGKIVDTSEEIALLRRKIFKNVKKKIFVCDFDKFGVSAPHNVADLRNMDYVITDAYLPDKYEFNGALIVV